MLVYDVKDPETFDALPEWLERVEDHAPENVVLMVLGNKRDSLDTEPAVPTAQAQAFATQIGAAFKEVSAKTGSGVNEAFQQIAEEAVDQIRIRPPIRPDPPRPQPPPSHDYPRILAGAALAVALGIAIYRRL